ncbi:MAG: prepilin peptidase [Alphaproteobacteria bacterium]
MEFIIIIEIILAGALGLILGSFATALVHRVPQNMSWAVKRSFCPSCKTALGFFDLFPVFSWCINGGACRHCSEKISLFYPLVELVSMLACLAVYGAYGFSVSGLFIYASVPFLLSLLLIDYKYMVLPNQLVLVLFVLGVVRLLFFWGTAGYGYDSGMLYFFEYFLTAFISGLVIWLLGAVVSRLVGRDSLGFGDVKFFVVAGLWLGLSAMPFFMVLSGFCAVVMALLWRFLKGQDVFPFGPALIGSFFMVLIYQGSTVNWGKSIILLW